MKVGMMKHGLILDSRTRKKDAACILSTCCCKNSIYVCLFISLLFDTSYCFPSVVPHIPVHSLPRHRMSLEEECLENALMQHKKEVTEGFQVWGQSKHFQKEEFPCDKVEVPLSSIGPDGISFFSRNNFIYKTQQPLFTAKECENLIEEVKQQISIEKSVMENDSDRSANDDNMKGVVSHAELNEARISTLPEGKKWLQQSMHEKLFPFISSIFGIPVEDLTCQDALCIGYDPHAIPSSQPIHRDASLITCNIALTPLTPSPSDQSELGIGGTYIEALQSTLQNEQGHVMTHLGGIMHAGVGKASRTERWVLVVFCLAKNVPQIARYCHKMGLDQLRDFNDLNMAKNYYLSGLKESPNDALLHQSLGNIYLRLHGEDDNMVATSKSNYNNLAKHHFRLAAHHYPHNAEALVTLGKVFLSEKRPRAALRYFDKSLQNVALEDGEDKMRSQRAISWETRMLAARCALMCACWEEHKYKDQPFSRKWSKQHLPVALDRIAKCLKESPQNESLHKMYSHTQYLLHQFSPIAAKS